MVDAVADAPTLVLTDLPGQGREVFRTGWETVQNKNSTSTLVQQKTLEGWTLITRPDTSSGGSNGFEIWSSGDKMMNAANQNKTVNAAAGNGNNWLELNNSGGGMHQTLGFERSVDTVAGATYTLSLDIAGRIGYSADYTRIGITIDGQRIGGHAGTSPADQLNWQTLQFQFVGSGGSQTLRIVSEATKFDANGRGAMIDDIALTETLPANTGFEDAAIRLSTVSAALKDVDGSETLKVEIAALPIGATLTDGTNTFTATADVTTADVTGWNLNNLSLVPPQDWNGSFTLRVVATTTEQSNGDQAVTSANIAVTVLPVNDAPVAASAIYAMEEGGQLTIDFSELISDVDGDLLTLSIDDPDHGKLTRNADGTYTYIPRNNFDGVDIFSYTVSDGTTTTTGWIAIIVTEDENGCRHHHYFRGHHTGHQYPDGEDADSSNGQTASIIVRSVNPEEGTVTIDWEGAPNGELLDMPLDQPEWLAEVLGIPQPDNRTLAEITGLIVRMDE
jgi:hypothetical protein